jgi:hypothetical protein
MLELTQKTLREVSFDAALFQKELLKALKWLKEKEDIDTFKNWCYTEFGGRYRDIMELAFR